MAGVLEDTDVPALSEPANSNSATINNPTLSRILTPLASDLGDEDASDAAIRAALPPSVDSEVQEERLQARRQRIAKRREDARRKAAG